MAEVIHIEDEDLGPIGHVVIDSTIRGQAGGGLRMHDQVEEKEIATLARVMTLKFGFYGIPKGGAKAGIRYDPEGDPVKVRERLAAFGKQICPLMEARRFFPGPDLGTCDREIRYIYEASGFRTRDTLLWNSSRTGRYAGIGVAHSFLETARHIGIPPAECTAQLEGLGSVGYPVLELLTEQGVKVIAVANRHGAIHNDQGIDPGGLKRYVQGKGERLCEFPEAEPVSRNEFLALKTTGFLPCAESFSIDRESADFLQTRMIVPGANAPLGRGAGKLIRRKGIMSIPDFVANAGGILGSALVFGGLTPRTVEESVSSMVGGTTGQLLRCAGSDELSLRALAESIALARFEKMKETSSSGILRLGLALRRRGLLPAAAGRILTRRFIVRHMDEMKSALKSPLADK